MPQAVLKSAELLNQLKELTMIPEVDEFTLKRLANEAEKLIAVDPVSAYLALGRVAVLQLDVEKVHTNFKYVAQIAGQDKRVWRDYSTSLNILGYGLEAANIVKNQLKRSMITYDLDYIDVAISICSFAGLFFTAQYFVEIFNKKSQDYIHPLTDTLDNTVAFMEKLQIEEEMLTPLFKIHFDILRKHDVILRKTVTSPQMVSIECDKALQEFRYEVYIPKSVEKVCEMADELAEAVAEIDLPADVVYHFYPLYRVKENFSIEVTAS